MSLKLFPSIANFEPLIEAVVDVHADLDELRADPQQRAAYVMMVQAMIVHTASKRQSGEVTLTDLHACNLVEIFCAVHNLGIEATDIFSYRHFVDAYTEYNEVGSSPEQLAAGSAAQLAMVQAETLRSGQSRWSRGSGDRVGHTAQFAALANCLQTSMCLQPAVALRLASSQSLMMALDPKCSDHFSFFAFARLKQLVDARMEGHSLQFWFRCLDLNEDSVLTEGTCWSRSVYLCPYFDHFLSHTSQTKCAISTTKKAPPHSGGMGVRSTARSVPRTRISGSSSSI